MFRTLKESLITSSVQQYPLYSDVQFTKEHLNYIMVTSDISAALGTLHAQSAPDISGTLLFISYKFVKGFLAITLFLVISS